MSLIICPECAHEVSTTAAACPNCGHLIAPPIVKTRTIVQEVPREREGFPPWAFIPLGVLGLLIVFLLFWFLRSDDTANNNINVNVSARKPIETRETTVRNNPPPNEVAVPPSSQPQQVIVPPSAPSSAPSSSETTITTVDPDKSSVSLEAKIATKSGSVQSVRNEKFYLLDEDLASILSDANLSDETGQSTTTAFGMSIVFPDKYNETRKKALDAINKRVKYSVTTDSSGKAEMKSVKPGSYYLFAITKSGNGFAVWSSPVSIVPGQNVLNIPPVSLTEVTQ
ncbi:MAG: hypothetical protein M3Q78_01850 [Acidobacteriota bacterium]|nr:hypothetical protein [Acidobacteriota bacterium]